MMTVVDQVRPWLMPSSTLATTTQPQRRRPDQQQRHGEADEPAGDEDGLAAVAVREGAGEEVGRGLGRAEGDDERERGGERGEAELRSASSGRTVRSWPIIPPTRALTPTSSENWARFARSPRWTGAARPGRAGAVIGAGLQRRPVAVGPVVGSADEHGDVAAAGAGEQARGGHGPLAVPAHHDGRAARGRRRRGPARSPSSTCSAPGTCPAANSLSWRTSSTATPAVAARQRAGLDERDGRDGTAAGGPRVDAAGELAGEVLVADLRACQTTRGVLVGVEDEDERPVGGDEPAEPGGERGAQRDRHRARDVAARRSGDRAGVDDQAPRGQQPRTSAAPSPGRVAGARRSAGPAAVQLAAAAGSTAGRLPSEPSSA